MPKTKEQHFQAIADCGVIAVIRAPSKEMLPDIAKALVAGGVLGIEVTMSTPKAIDGIEMLADALGVPAAHVEVVKGLTSPRKEVLVRGVPLEELRRRIDAIVKA